MYNLLNVYDCPNCGKILSDQVDMINTQLADDQWGKVSYCRKCHREAKIRMHIDPVTKQEIYHYEEVDDERARWANGFYDDLFTDDNFPN